MRAKRVDECFRLIGAQSVKLDSKLHRIFVEDFRRELAAIESPEAKRICLLIKANHLLHLEFNQLSGAPVVWIEGDLFRREWPWPLLTCFASTRKPGNKAGVSLSSRRNLKAPLLLAVLSYRSVQWSRPYRFPREA
jgi:hypothetical protein